MSLLNKGDKMNGLRGKKLLILGGKPIGSCEIVEKAKSMGIYTVVTDFLPVEESAAKKIADEHWEISTADIELLKEKIIEEKIDGVYTGVHEFNIRKMIEICQDLKMPCFCTLEQWDTLNNKKEFKRLCQEYKIPISKEYTTDDIKENRIKYPVIIKPADGSGSRGFSICYNKEELLSAHSKALDFSPNGQVLIEQRMNYENSAIINYTFVDGKCYFSGISDKKSKKVFEDGAPIMSVQFYPSKYQKEYIRDLNGKVQKMFLDFGIRNGVVWIEAFCDDGEFVFNEMGFRFGGSLTYLPVNHFFGIEQLSLQIEYALLGCNKQRVKVNERKGDMYCVWPVHVRQGLISKIDGLDTIQSKKELVKIVPVHFLGDKIENWGSAQQVFAYIHFICKTKDEANGFMDFIFNKLKVYDEKGRGMLFNLYR